MFRVQTKRVDPCGINQSGTYIYRTLKILKYFFEFQTKRVVPCGNKPVRDLYMQNFKDLKIFVRISNKKDISLRYKASQEHISTQNFKRFENIISDSKQKG